MVRAIHLVAALNIAPLARKRRALGWKNGTTNDTPRGSSLVPWHAHKVADPGGSSILLKDIEDEHRTPHHQCRRDAEYFPANVRRRPAVSAKDEDDSPYHALDSWETCPRRGRI